MNVNKEIEHVIILGGNGFVGSACTRIFNKEYRVSSLSSKEVDLTNQSQAIEVIGDLKPDAIVNAAGRVGGILFNSQSNFEQLHINSKIGLSVAAAIQTHAVPFTVNLSSSCAYPLDAPRPIKEESMRSGKFEPTNAGYALAKLFTSEAIEIAAKAGGCKALTIIPCNVYGPGDCYDQGRSHVMAGLIRRMHEAREAGSACVIWGTGSPEREFIFVDDLAGAALHLTRNRNRHDFQYINVGSGKAISIRELARLIASVIGFEGELIFDATKPDGVFRKTMSVERLSSTQWSPAWSLRKGIEIAYDNFLLSRDGV